MQSVSRDQEIAKIRRIIDREISDLVDPSVPFALLDFPDHANIGDSAIYVGTIAEFEQRGAVPSYVSTAAGFSQEEMIDAIGDGPIFLLGGGSFGTLWPFVQNFREKLLDANRGRPIIQLPQTLFYDNQAAIDQTAKVIKDHGNFTLIVRDHTSYNLAAEHFQCDLRLCPDLAFAIGRVHRRPAAHPLLLNLRTDHEAAAQYETSKIEQSLGAIRRDWPVETSYWKDRVAGSEVAGLLGAYMRNGRNGFRAFRCRDLAGQRYRRGINLLSMGQTVVTDRMHGHILCYLMDIPHCVIDNSYGKTSSFIKAWGTMGGNVRIAASVDDAVAALSEVCE